MKPTLLSYFYKFERQILQIETTLEKTRSPVLSNWHPLMLLLLYIFYRVTYFHNELGITRLIYGTTPPPFYIRLYCCEPTDG